MSADKRPDPSDGPPNQALSTETARAPWVRRSALIELVLFFGIALAIDIFLGAGDRFKEIAPHPFWLIIVLLSVQYGTREGVLAAVLSIAILLAWNLPPQDLSQDQYAYLYEVTVTPILWVVAAVLFGELRMRQINERTRLREEHAAMKAREDVLTRQVRELDAVKDRLEERVAGQIKTVYSTYRAAREIESLGVGRVLMGMSNLVDSVLSPKKHSIFLLKGNDLQSTFGKGWDKSDNFARAFDARSRLFQAVIGAQEIVTVADPRGEEILDGQGILAGPLIDSETGEIIGMLKVEEMGFLDYNLATVESFRILCQWLAAAYSNARSFERAKSNTSFDPEANMMSSSMFDRISSIVTTTAERVGFDVSVLLFQIIQPSGLSPEERRKIIQKLGTTASAALRPSDVAFNKRQGGFDYTIILPNTSLENAEIVANKMRRRFLVETGEIAIGIDLKAAAQSLYKHDPNAPPSWKKSHDGGP